MKAEIDNHPTVIYERSQPHSSNPAVYGHENPMLIRTEVTDNYYYAYQDEKRNYRRSNINAYRMEYSHTGYDGYETPYGYDRY